MSKRVQDLKSKLAMMNQKFPPKRANVSASSASTVFSPLDVQSSFKKVAGSGSAKRSNRLDFAQLSQFVDPEAAVKISSAGDEKMDEDGDGAKLPDSVQRVEVIDSENSVEASNKPSAAGDEVMDEGVSSGAKVIDSEKTVEASNKPSAADDEVVGDAKVIDSKLRVEASNKPSAADDGTMDHDGVEVVKVGKGVESIVQRNVGDKDEDDDDEDEEEDDDEDDDDEEGDDEEEELDYIDSLQSLKAGKRFIESPLLLTVLKVPFKMFDRGQSGNQVANVDLQDCKGVKVRLPLWNRHGTTNRPIFFAHLGQKVLLSGVCLQAVTSPTSLEWLPDKRFPFELVVTGTLSVKKFALPSARLESMKDLLSRPGIYEGVLNVKVGLALNVIGYNRVDYKSAIVHDGECKFRIFFAPDVDVRRIKKSDELVLYKLRVIDDSGDRMVFVDSTDDFNLVGKTLRSIDQPARVKSLPDLFEPPIDEKKGVL